LGRDDHALRYEAGQRGVFFLDGRPGQDDPYPTDQLAGEALFVRAGDEEAWDAYLTTAIAAIARGGDPFAKPEYRAALHAALRAPAAALRAHGFRKMVRRLGTPRVDAADLAAVRTAILASALPPTERLAHLRLFLRYLAPSEVPTLLAGAGDAPAVRAGL